MYVYVYVYIHIYIYIHRSARVNRSARCWNPSMTVSISFCFSLRTLWRLRYWKIMVKGCMSHMYVFESTDLDSTHFALEIDCFIGILGAPC